MNVKKYRLAKSMTQQKLSEVIGISDRHLMRIEKGQVFPKDEVIKKMSDFFLISPVDFFRDDTLDRVISAYFEVMGADIDEKIDRKRKLLEDYLSTIEFDLGTIDSLKVDLLEFNIDIFDTTIQTASSDFFHQFGNEFNQIFQKETISEVELLLLLTYLNLCIVNYDYHNLSEKAVERFLTRKEVIGVHVLFNSLVKEVLARLIYLELIHKQSFRDNEFIQLIYSELEKYISSQNDYYYKFLYSIIQIIGDYYDFQDDKKFTNDMTEIINAILKLDSDLASKLKKLQAMILKNNGFNQHVSFFFL